MHSGLRPLGWAWTFAGACTVAEVLLEGCLGKRELGMLPEDSFNPENIRGKFVESTTHLKRRKENGGPAVSVQMAVVLIVLLGLLLYWLWTGDIPFLN